MTTKFKLKKGDNVIVISGEHKGKQGKITEVDKTNNRAFVEGVNMLKKHTKPTSKFPNGGIVETAGSIHISNLMFSDNGKPSKVGRKLEEGKLVRYSKKSNTIIK